jgi:hypothetical protein
LTSTRADSSAIAFYLHRLNGSNSRWTGLSKNAGLIIASARKNLSSSFMVVGYRCVAVIELRKLSDCKGSGAAGLLKKRRSAFGFLRKWRSEAAKAFLQ